MATTVAVTGGNGKIGEKILRNLSKHGYRTVNLARGKRREEISDEYRTTDLLDAGEVYGSLAISDADAVIHMGTIPAPTNHPGFKTYQNNVMSSYHILEASQSLELNSVCLASSINIMGSVYQESPIEVFYLPVDESHPLTPRDPYAMAKHVVEVTADGFGRLDSNPTTISSLRYPWVAHEDELETTFADEPRDLAGLRDAWHHTTRDVLFSYIHIEDAADLARLAIEADYDGHEAFWAVADDTTAAVNTQTLAEEFYPEAEYQSDFERFEGLIDIGKAKEMLGWEPQRTWRNL